MIEPVGLPLQRSPRQTLHHVWAPKLRRIVMLTGLDQLHLWAMLEAHPGVTKYCERPGPPDAAVAIPVADFWATRDGTPIWLRLVDAPEDTAASPAPSAADTHIELINPNELERHRVWIRNWLSLLPYLSTTSPLGLESLQAQVVEAVGDGAAFDEIERRFPRTDPVLTRTALIAGLHQGLLVSDDLQRRPWDRLTHVRTATRRDRHAPQ